MYTARTTCCDLAMATGCIVALMALLVNQTYGERLSTLSGVKAFLGALVRAYYQIVF